MSDDEKWVTAYGYPDYEVSDQGRVRSKVKSRYKNPGDMMYLSGVGKGYVSAGLYLNGVEHGRVSVHKLVLQSFCGAIPDGRVVNHIDGVKWNNRLENLEECSYSQNTIHAMKVLGTVNPKWPVHQGENQHKAVLTEDDVRWIRANYVRGGDWSYRKIADKFGMDQSSIAAVIKGTSWKHVK